MSGFGDPQERAFIEVQDPRGHGVYRRAHLRRTIRARTVIAVAHGKQRGVRCVGLPCVTEQDKTIRYVTPREEGLASTGADTPLPTRTCGQPRGRKTCADAEGPSRVRESLKNFRRDTAVWEPFSLTIARPQSRPATVRYGPGRRSMSGPFTTQGQSRVEATELAVSESHSWLSAGYAFLDIHATARFVSLSVSTVQDLVRRGEFPAPRQIAQRRVAWLLRELIEWCESRPRSALPPPTGTGHRSMQAS
jgi:prophage regulatory protein